MMRANSVVVKAPLASEAVTARLLEFRLSTMTAESGGTLPGAPLMVAYPSASGALTSIRLVLGGSAGNVTGRSNSVIRCPAWSPYRRSITVGGRYYSGTGSR